MGRLGLVDHDEVELSNLHRQVGHTQARLGVNKARSLAASLEELNSEEDATIDAFLASQPVQNTVLLTTHAAPQDVHEVAGPTAVPPPPEHGGWWLY